MAAWNGRAACLATVRWDDAARSAGILPLWRGREGRAAELRAPMLEARRDACDRFPDGPP